MMTCAIFSRRLKGRIFDHDSLSGINLPAVRRDWNDKQNQETMMERGKENERGEQAGNRDQLKEEKYGALIESMNAIVWEVDLDTLKFNYVSPQAEVILGYPSEKWEDFEFWAGLVHPEDREYAVSFCQAETEKGEDHEFEYRMMAADGRIVWIRDIVTVLKENDKPYALSGYLMDVTEHRKVEEALKESEERYRMLFMNVPFGWAYHRIIVDGNNKPIDYIFLEVNDAFEKQTGLKREDSIGNKVTEVLPGIEKDPANWIGRYGEVAQTGKGIRFDNYAEPLGKWFSVTAFSPKKGYFIVVFDDITKRMKAEEELEIRAKEIDALNVLNQKVSSKLDLDMVVDAALDGLVSLINPDTTILFLREEEYLLTLGYRVSSQKFRHKETKRHKIGQCMCGLAVTEGKPVFSNDIFSDLRCTWDECKSEGMHSFAALPLKSGGSVIGVLAVGSASIVHFEERASFLEALAGEVSIGFQNALLYEKVKNHSDEIEFANKELMVRTEELKRINKAFVGRELKMVELKKEIEELKARSGKS